MGVQLAEVFFVARMAAEELGLTHLPRAFRQGTILTGMVENMTSVRV